MSSTNVLVIGAAGNLGRRLVEAGLRHGHKVSALVRDRAAFASKMPQHGIEILEGDIRAEGVLARALKNQGAVVNAAGNVNDGTSFSDLFDTIVDAIEGAPQIRKAWFLAGAAILTVPHTNRIGVGLPFVPALYKPHERNWHRLESSPIDWSLMCPGPMTAAETGVPLDVLRVSTDTAPYELGRWARYAPPPALSLAMKSKLPEMIVTYESVAELIMSNMQPESRFSRRRVGVALPIGERRTKEGWALGRRGPDA